METQRHNVAVIMRTKNSAWVVEDVLKGLFSQTYTAFELLVVDSGSTDNTLEIVRRYPCRVIEIEPTAYVPGIVLNMAIAHTQGGLVVFLNSDTIPLHPEALTNLLAAFDDPAVHAAFARQTPRPEADAWVRRDYATSFPERGPAPPWMSLSLPFAAVRRETIVARPFYTSAWASEDNEWGHWAKTHGLGVGYVPEAVVMHSHNYTLRQIYGRQFVEGEADAFIYGRHDTLAGMFTKWATAVVRDWAWCVRLGRIAEMAVTPVRRFVYVWAHRKGSLFGAQRIRDGDHDPTKGQQVVLARYE